MASDKYDCLKLESQLCFPLYVCSKEIVRRYKPYLDELDLTYTQYITMLALWEHAPVTVKALGDLLYLDSNTLTPLLKTLEKKGYLTRTRSKEDERSLILSLTNAGKQLKRKAVGIPSKMGKCVSLNDADAMELYRILHIMMEQWQD